MQGFYWEGSQHFKSFEQPSLADLSALKNFFQNKYFLHVIQTL